MTPAPLLEVEGVDVRLGGTTILRNASLRARRAELVAVVGPNGAGKSTLARVAAGLLRPAAGEVRWAGVDLRRIGARQRARQRAYVPQRARIADGIRLREAVELGRSAHIGLLGRPGRADRDAVASALSRSGTRALADRRLSTLSGGELQRAQLAIALAQQAPLLIADEPTASLDLGASTSVARLLRDLADSGLGVVLVAHDLALAAAVADTVVVVHAGRTVAAGAPLDVLDAERLEEVWEVGASLQCDGAGSTALRVDWLAGVHGAGAALAVDRASPWR